MDSTCVESSSKPTSSENRNLKLSKIHKVTKEHNACLIAANSKQK
jgi:hypothetical protein